MAKNLRSVTSKIVIFTLLAFSAPVILNGDVASTTSVTMNSVGSSNASFSKVTVMVISDTVLLNSRVVGENEKSALFAEIK